MMSLPECCRVTAYQRDGSSMPSISLCAANRNHSSSSSHMTRSSSNAPTCSSSCRDTTTLGTAMTVSDFSSFSRIQPSGTGQLRVRCRVSRIARFVHQDEPRVTPLASAWRRSEAIWIWSLSRQPDIVGVEKSDIFAFRFAQRGIAYNRGPSAVRQPDHFDARRIVEGSQVVPRVRARAVVRDEEFPVLEGLFEYGSDRRAQKLQAIERGQDDRYGRRHAALLKTRVSPGCFRLRASKPPDRACARAHPRTLPRASGPASQTTVRARSARVPQRARRASARAADAPQCIAQRTRITARPQRSHRPPAGERTKGRNVGDDRRQSAGERLDQRNSRCLPGDFRARIGPPLASVARFSRAGTRPSRCTLLAQRRNPLRFDPEPRAAAAPTPKQQYSCSRGSSRAAAPIPSQHRERVLVGIQVSDPQDGRIAREAGEAARLLPVSGRETAGGFRDFIQPRCRAERGRHRQTVAPAPVRKT